MTTYRGWIVYGPVGEASQWAAVRGKVRVTAGTAEALRVAVDQQERASGRAFDTGAL